MSFSENAIISIRNNARLRRERTFLNLESSGTCTSLEYTPLTKSEKSKLANAENKRNRAIFIYYAILAISAMLVVGYVIAFQW